MRGAGEARAPDSCGPAPHVVRFLALLRDAPVGIAEATIALLPYEARCDLAVRGLVDVGDADAASAAPVHVTDHGRRLICGS